MDMKQWKMKADEVFCARLKFQSNKYKIIFHYSDDMMEIDVFDKNNKMVEFNYIFRDIEQHTAETLIDLIERYSVTEVRHYEYV